MRALIFAALIFCLAGIARGQEIRQAVPVEQPSAPDLPEVRRAIPVEQTAPAPTASAEPEIRKAIPVVPPGSMDDLTKFLAGIALPDSSPLARSQKSPAYDEHIKALSRLLRRYSTEFFTKMQAWSTAELSQRISLTRPVVYFFGGPDAISPLAYFPDAPVYILGGLETVGSIAPPESLPPEELIAALANLRKSTESILSFGHFITKDMKAELDRTAFRGVLPVICTFLALANNDIVSITPGAIHDDGTFRAAGAEAAIAGKKETPLPAVKIVFRRVGGAFDAQTLYYVQANVVNDALKARSGLLTWVESFGKANVYHKAASYLLHESGFSRIRDFLLADAAAVLQDDSGLPFRSFDSGHWTLTLYGVYDGTLGIFKPYEQADLRAAFAVPGAPTALPFGTGYKWRTGQSNLVLAVKSAASTENARPAR